MYFHQDRVVTYECFRRRPDQTIAVEVCHEKRTKAENAKVFTNRRRRDWDGRGLAVLVVTTFSHAMPWRGNCVILCTTEGTSEEHRQAIEVFKGK